MSRFAFTKGKKQKSHEAVFIMGRPWESQVHPVRQDIFIELLRTTCTEQSTVVLSSVVYLAATLSISD